MALSHAAADAAGSHSVWPQPPDTEVDRHEPYLPAAGDDTDVHLATTTDVGDPGFDGNMANTPVAPSWTAAVCQAFAADDALMLLVLRDACDPGFPSFPVLRADRHMAVMGGQLLPACFLQGGVNQGEPGHWQQQQGAS